MASGHGPMGPDDFQSMFGVSRETVEKLETYAASLKQWQKAVQLVAPSTLDAVWSRHFADSAQLLALAPPDWRRWVDLGSGAGFPGLVIAILSPPDPAKRIMLVESDTRKAAFLGEVARKTGVAVDIVPARIESSSTHAKVVQPDVISARALAPLDRLLGLVSGFWGPVTVGLFQKGREAAAEVAAAQTRWRFDVSFEPSLTEPDSRIVRVQKLVAITEG